MPQGIAVSRVKTEVLTALEREPDTGLWLGDIVKRTRYSKANVVEALEALMHEGRVEPVDPDTYLDQYRLTRDRTPARKDTRMSSPSPAAGPFARTHTAPTGAAAKAGPPPAAGESTASPAPLVIAVTALPSIDHTGVIQSARDAADALRRENERLRHALAVARRGRMVYRLAYREMRAARAKTGRSLETQLYLSRTANTRVRELEMEVTQIKGERDEISLGLATVRAALSSAGYTQGNLVDRIAQMGSALEAWKSRALAAEARLADSGKHAPSASG